MFRRSVVGLSLAAALLVSFGLPAAAGARSVTSDLRGPQADADISSALDSAGNYVGGAEVAGQLDLEAWALTSDLAAGERPRFERTPSAGAGAITPNAWSALGGGGVDPFFGALNSHVYAIAVAGTDVYVGGNFVNAGGIPAADFIAKWNGTAWSALLGPGNSAPFASGWVNALLYVGDTLYAGGNFSNAGGDAQADNVAQYRQGSWSDVAVVVSGDGAVPGEVNALAKNGANLYVGGYFNNSPATAFTPLNAGDMILRFDGSWQPLGQRPCCLDQGNGALNGRVRALVATSTGVIAGGDFSDVAADTTIDYLAEFTIDTGTWARFHSATPNQRVHALHGTAANMYVGGDFTDFNALPLADYLVRWNGTGWVALGGSDGTSAIQARVYSIVVSGGTVYIGGDFENASGNLTADRVAKWNGSIWSGLGSNGSGNGAINQGGEGDQGWVRALALSSNALYTGGNFRNVANIPEADYLAAYGLGAITNQKPDGRIKKGSGTLVGNNIYNTTGVNQTRTGTAAVNATMTFTISIQNDGTQTGKFKVAATASGNVNFQVTYFRGTTNITTGVVNGTYVTGNVAAGNVWAITAKVKVTPSVVSGASTTRLITITSNADSSKVDAVKLIGKRS